MLLSGQLVWFFIVYHKTNGIFLHHVNVNVEWVLSSSSSISYISSSQFSDATRATLIHPPLYARTVLVYIVTKTEKETNFDDES